MKLIKRFLRNWCPPIVMSWILKIYNPAILFKGDYNTWEEASKQCIGYDNEIILDKVLNAAIKVKKGEYAYERDSVLFDEIEYPWPMLAGLLWVAARSKGKLNVLDFGGALGSSYFQNLKFLQSLPEMNWNVVEQPHYVEAGQLHIQDDKLKFYKTIDECLKENQPNFVLLSSVLQYLESPKDLILELKNSGASVLYIDRTPFSNKAIDHLVIQNVPKSIYSASYPMWIFSLSELIKILAEDWQIIATNVSPEGTVHTESDFEFFFQGILLESRK